MLRFEKHDELTILSKTYPSFYQIVAFIKNKTKKIIAVVKDCQKFASYIQFKNVMLLKQL